MTAAPVVGALVVVAVLVVDALVLVLALVLVVVAEAAGAAEDEEFEELDPQAAARSAVAAISAESDLRTG